MVNFVPVGPPCLHAHLVTTAEPLANLVSHWCT
jgi:hypothetical protein